MGSADRGAQADGNPSKKMLILAWSKKKKIHFSWPVACYLVVGKLGTRRHFPGSSAAPPPVPVPSRAHPCSATSRPPPWPSPCGPGLCSSARAGAPRGESGSAQRQLTLAAPICSLRNFSSGVISTSLAFSIYGQRQAQLTFCPAQPQTPVPLNSLRPLALRWLWGCGPGDTEGLVPNLLLTQ